MSIEFFGQILSIEKLQKSILLKNRVHSLRSHFYLYRKLQLKCTKRMQSSANSTLLKHIGNNRNYHNRLYRYVGVTMSTEKKRDPFIHIKRQKLKMSIVISIDSICNPMKIFTLLQSTCLHDLYHNKQKKFLNRNFINKRNYTKKSYEPKNKQILCTCDKVHIKLVK